MPGISLLSYRAPVGLEFSVIFAFILHSQIIGTVDVPCFVSLACKSLYLQCISFYQNRNYERLRVGRNYFVQ